MSSASESQSSNGLNDGTPLYPEGNDWAWLPVSLEWWTALQLMSAVLGIIGNLLVILVLFGRKTAFRSTDALIGALAIADLLTSVFMIPIPVAIRVPSSWLGEFYCKVVYTGRPMWISISASVFTLTATSIERFIAVAYPFRFRDLFSKRRTVKIVITVWMMAFVMNSFAFFVFFVDDVSATCVIHFPTPNGAEILGIVSFFLVLVIPILIMVTSQSMAAYVLHRESKRFTGKEDTVLPKSHPSFRLLIAKKRVMKLLCVIIVIYIVCWAPNQSAYLAFNLGLLGPSYLFGPVDRTLTVLAFCNSCANPVIYSIQHEQFRDAVKQMLSCSETTKLPIFGNKMEEKDGNPDQRANHLPDPSTKNVTHSTSLSG